MSGEDKQQEQTIAEDLKMGGDITNRALRSLVEASSSGVSVLSLGEKSDAIIMQETGNIFKKEKDMKNRKGIAFPTSISVNNCDYILKEGDLVKIDLGVPADGFTTNVAHTFVVDVAQGTQITGRKADVIKAAHHCAEGALCLVKPGNQNTQVTETGNKVAHLKQHVIDGEKTITQNGTDQQKKDREKRTTIYKRDPSKQHFDATPFTFRACEDEKKARLGVVERPKHGLLQPFNVLYEKEGEFAAQFKFTALLMPSGPMRITSGPFQPDPHKSEMEVQDAELKTLLQNSASRKTQKKKKKKASKTAENATTGETLEENEAGDLGGSHLPSLLLLPHPLPTTPQTL
uniref:Peptidase M24 domain-containing protein n=1 Tax=Mandrillus leucophaeus TaxID=9568 RepID=A0A2K5ZHC8_MANLE